MCYVEYYEFVKTVYWYRGTECQEPTQDLEQSTEHLEQCKRTSRI